jgi:hypothetical protein
MGMNVVTPGPLQPPIDPQGRIFDNGVVGGVGSYPGMDMTDPSVYEYTIRALIDDAKSFEDSTLGPDREDNLQYFYGDEPQVEGLDEEGVPTSSTVVSTDVRDTVMAIIPSLIRIFTSPEHVVFCSPNHSGQEDLAKQQTDYLEYLFWEDNNGFMLIHDALKDALTTKTCVAYWYTDNSEEVVTQEFHNVPQEQLQLLVSENETVEIIDQTPSEAMPGLFDSITLKWTVNKPIIKIEGVPLDEFRVSRDARTVEDAALLGFDTIVRRGQLIAAGYDEAVLDQYTGATPLSSSDRMFRNSGLDETSVLENLEIRYGEYFIRIDKDGDGIEELRKICTVGDDHYILEDYAVQYPTFAVGSPDPKSHTLIGDCPADLVKDIQRIKTNMLRGALDSLAQTIWPRTVFNEMLVTADDVLNEEIGAAIRTKGTPAETIMSLTTPFVGEPVFGMLDVMERLRQQRTGISDASKGLDPKALQSTALSGVDAIISGAQERIELIARLFAETYLKPIFKGLLREISNSPNQKRVVSLRGKWVDVDPSTFDPSMRISVNPTLGKGSDISRLMALQEVKNTQIMILEKFGIKNPVVGPTEFINTVVDMMAIANVKNSTRYFKEITPEQMDQIMNAPEDPAPEMILAQAEMEKTRAKMAQNLNQADKDDKKLRWDDDFRRDELMVKSLLDVHDLELKYAADINEQEIEAQNVRNEAE